VVVDQIASLTSDPARVKRRGAAVRTFIVLGAVSRVNHLGGVVEGNLIGDPVYYEMQQTLPGFRP